MSEPFKRVILLSPKTNVVGGVVQFVKDLTGAFPAIGVASEWMRLDGNDQYLAMRSMAEHTARGERTFLFDVNGRVLTDGAPKFTWLVDHPVEHPHLALLAADSVVGVVDESHLDHPQYMPGRKRVFLPHGGPAPAPDLRPMAERDIPVFFCANIAVSPTRDGFAHVIRNSSPIMSEIALNAFDRIVEGYEEPTLAVLAALAARGVAPDDLGREGLAKFVSAVNSHAQARERLEVLQALEGCSVHVAGYLDDAIKRVLPSDAVDLGPCDDFGRVRAYMGRSRFVLNATAKFSRGSHERIWYGLASGAAILTNRSSYLDRFFGEGQGVMSYATPAPLAETVKEALSDPDRLEKQARAGREIYVRHHLWQNRAAAIMEAVDSE